MATPIKLFVDKIYNNGDNGETYKSDEIYKNLENLGYKILDDFTDSFATNGAGSFFYSAGRFLIIVSMTFNRNEQGMIIMDLKKNEKMAKEIAINKGGDETEVNKFMAAFYEGLINYDSDFNKFILNDAAL